MKFTATLMLAGTLLPLAASADEKFRCGKWVVSSDMTVAELSAKCGAPSSQATSTQDIQVRNQFGLMSKVGETVTETWIFERGPRAQPMVVTIIDGRIKSIERQK